jgi:hypothetical protein
LATVARLVTAADGDTVYRDVYLRRASELLSPLIAETHYESALVARDQLAKLVGQARAAVTRQDWPKVRELGSQASALQHSLDAEGARLSAAESVYGAPPVVLDPWSPGLPPSKRWSVPAQARTDVVSALVELAREDPPARELYATRQRALEALVVPGSPAAGPETTSGASAAHVEQQALQALERGDVAALQGLADSMLGGGTGAREAGEEGAPARGRIVAPASLGEPLPEACLRRAATLGLEPVEATIRSAEVAREIGDFVERYALGASAAVHERARDGIARLTVAAEEVAVSPELAAIFAETLSLFALHAFVNSAGLRYVPVPAPREVLLVESHADGDEAVTPLLRELGLAQRRALARDDIEVQLRKNGARVVTELLGLDPLVFRIVCIPPDVFMRVGRERGWGQRPEWTHFDGYQVMKGGRLRALVGGNVRFGGLFDLCSISGDDGRDNTVVRFAVIRRDRLGVRIA